MSTEFIFVNDECIFTVQTEDGLILFMDNANLKDCHSTIQIVLSPIIATKNLFVLLLQQNYKQWAFKRFGFYGTQNNQDNAQGSLLNDVAQISLFADPPNSLSLPYLQPFICFNTEPKCVTLLMNGPLKQH